MSANSARSAAGVGAGDGAGGGGVFPGSGAGSGVEVGAVLNPGAGAAIRGGGSSGRSRPGLLASSVDAARIATTITPPTPIRRGAFDFSGTASVGRRGVATGMRWVEPTFFMAESDEGGWGAGTGPAGAHVRQ